MSVKPSRPKPPVYCSFCGKSSEEVAFLIAGPTVFICDECLELCTDIMGERLGVPEAEREKAIKTLFRSGAKMMQDGDLYAGAPGWRPA